MTCDAPGPSTIIGDEGRLRQLLGNLVANALSYTPAGSPARDRRLLPGRRGARTSLGGLSRGRPRPGYSARGGPARVRTLLAIRPALGFAPRAVPDSGSRSWPPSRMLMVGASFSPRRPAGAPPSRSSFRPSPRTGPMRWGGAETADDVVTNNGAAPDSEAARGALGPDLVRCPWPDAPRAESRAGPELPRRCADAGAPRGSGVPRADRARVQPNPGPAEIPEASLVRGAPN